MTWLETQVRNVSLRQLGACALVIAGAIGLLAANQRYLTNYFAGSYAIPRAELFGAPSADDLPRYWVTAKPDRVMDTGVDIITVRKKRGVERSRSVTGHYYVGQIGDRLMLIKSPSEQDLNGATLDGALVAPSSDLIDRLVDDSKQPGLRQRFLPLMLDTSDFTFDAALLLWGAGIASALAALWALMAGRRAASPAGHPALQSLMKTPGMSLADASHSIEAEVKARQVVKLKQGVQLTSGFAVQSAALKFKVRPLAELLWAYPVVTKKKLYYVIPAGKSHSLVLNYPDKSETYSGSEAQTRAAMEHLVKAVPWALFGYSDDFVKAYKKERAKLAAFVAGRRAEAMSGVASGS